MLRRARCAPGRSSHKNEWTIAETVYTILDDGSVWRWNFTYGIGTILGYWLGGLIVGLVVGIVISLAIWRMGQ
jgi:hypothetical protein